MNQMAEEGKRISHSNQFLFVSLNWRQLETSLYKLRGCNWHTKHSAMQLNCACWGL